MPRPKSEPTKVYRLPTALMEPLEAEATARKLQVVDVLRERLNPAKKTKPPTPTAAPRAKATATTLVWGCKHKGCTWNTAQRGKHCPYHVGAGVKKLW